MQFAQLTGSTLDKASLRLQTVIRDILAILAESEAVCSRCHIHDAQIPERSRNAPRDIARTLLRQRRRRDAILGPSLFGEPAWDMLLDLFAAQEEGQRVSVSSLCIAAAVPSTTALRWIKLLETQGMLVRRSDSRDQRRTFIELSPTTSATIRHMLREWAE